jgi:hypothetical protein
MKYLYPLAILLIVLPLLTKAQSNFKPGYIITTTGDTLHGAIDYQDWEGNPKLFRFKAGSSTDIKRFTVSTANYILINELAAYQKHVVDISSDITDIQHLETFRDTSFTTDTVFLKVLQQGKNVTLYSYTDHLKTRYYVKETASGKSPYELIYRTYKPDGRTFTDNTFVKQLFELSAKFKTDNEEAANIIEHAEYKKEDILKAISAINNISAAEYKLKYKDKTRVLFFAGVGASITTFQLKSVQAGSLLNNTSTMPMLTAGLDIVGNPATSRLIFRVEAALTENKFKENFPNATEPYYPLNYSFSLIGFSIIPQIVYNVYNTENFKLYVSPGVQLVFISEKDAHYNQVNGSMVTPIDPLLLFNKASATAAFKVGAKINKHFDVSGSYLLPSGITRLRDGEINVKSLFIGFNYYFGKN